MSNKTLVLVASVRMIAVWIYNAVVFTIGIFLVIGGFFLEGQRSRLFDLFGDSFALALMIFFICAVTCAFLFTDISFYRESLAQNASQTIVVATMVTLICSAELSAVIGGFIMRNKVFKNAEISLSEGMKEYTRNSTRWINTIQNDFKCCGLESYQDWKPYLGAKKIPDTCCITYFKGCGNAAAGASKPSGNLSVGCMHRLRHWMSSDVIIYCSVMLVILMLQIVGMSLGAIQTCGQNVHQKIDDFRKRTNTFLTASTQKMEENTSVIGEQH